jgi:DNA-directed RNA polymerase subunit RPC12/RpoP
MSRSARDLILRGIVAAKDGAKDEARFYLEKALMIDATSDQRTEACVWLSEISDDPAEKRDHLESALSLDPAHPVARRQLALLDGRLKAEEIVDPDRIPAAAPEKPQSSQTRRFVCRQCGGRMAFTPDGKTLVCAYCDRQQTLIEALREGALDSSEVKEHDFTVALATAKGHTRPVATRTFKCQGCGAAFALSPEMLSSTCPYCASAYVVEEDEVLELISPEGVIPFAVNRDEALRAALRWLKADVPGKQSLIGRPTGVYFPVWTFDIGGGIRWRCLVYEDDRWVPRTGVKAVYKDDLAVPASHALPKSVADVVREFRFKKVVPYDPAYLADWPAGTYEISVSDASLVARHRIFTEAREKIPRGFFGQVKNLNTSSTSLIIESFKLVLLPLWIGRYRHGDEDKDKRRYTVVVNGQTGTVRGEKPAQGLRKLWGWLMGNDQ